MKAVFAHVSNIKAFPSQSTARIELEIPIEAYRAVVDQLFGRDVLVTIAPDALNGAPYGVVEPQFEPDTARGAGGKANRPGPLCMLAVQWCRDPLFWKWMGEVFKFEPKSQEDAAMFLRDYLDIESRRDIDTNDAAAQRFKAHVRLPYMAYMEKAATDERRSD